MNISNLMRVELSPSKFTTTTKWFQIMMNDNVVPTTNVSITLHVPTTIVLSIIIVWIHDLQHDDSAQLEKIKFSNNNMRKIGLLYLSPPPSWSKTQPSFQREKNFSSFLVTISHEVISVHCGAPTYHDSHTSKNVRSRAIHSTMFCCFSYQCCDEKSTLDTFWSNVCGVVWY